MPCHAVLSDLWAARLPVLPCLIPLGLSPVAAGFPSPAADYEDRRLDVSEYLIRNPVSTFFFRVSGDSMVEAEIFDGDMLVVDRSVTPQHGHIVVAFLRGERLVKRLEKRGGGRVVLCSANQAYPDFEVSDADELVVWGVVVGKFKRLL
uniref:Translesion error-prone DNA polymerase V autoproteolytic subunit n=2 Tax=Aromatoleum toluolicum TaxID=90060 RepID=A0ABX1NAC4_9RHOO|nr:translesion error-prone DNA polymerase V autoproteolytic subunit [Aromatoleum toluolicum]